MRNAIVLSVCLLLHLPCYSQKYIAGTVTDASNGEILSYVNIGIRNKNIGTVTNDSGKFSLDLPQQYTNDTLTFSMVGYKEWSLPVAEASQLNEYELQPTVVGLRAYTFSAKRPIERKYGLWRYRPFLHFVDGSIKQNDAFEIAQRISLGESKAKITSVNLHLNETQNDSATFRINFYKYEGNRPGQRAVEKSIVQRHAVHNGWLKFNISPYNIQLKGDIVVGIEFMPRDSKSRAIQYEVKPGGRQKSFVRTSSLGTWHVPPHQYRMYVTAITSADSKADEEEEKEYAPVFALYSKYVADSFCLYVHLPKDYNNTNKNYPAVYVLDANVYFGFLADSLDKSNGQQYILIGIGYKDFAMMDSLRNRDYTYPEMPPLSDWPISGGGDQFYSFITEELIPYIDTNYRTEAKRRLMGHSLGGYFTLFALYKELQNKTDYFQHYIAPSPSVEYYNQYLTEQFEKMNVDSNAIVKHVLLSWGDKEDEDDDVPGKYDEAVNSMKIQLLRHNSLKVESTLLNGAAHMETALPSFYNGLQNNAMNEITIRPATKHDLKAIYTFICLLEEQEFDFEEFATCFAACFHNPNNYYLIAEANGKPIGYLSCHAQILLHYCGRVYEIQELYVNEAYRGKGVGRLLLDKIEQILSTQTYDVLEVSSNMRRKDAHRFYLANGFEQTTYKFKKAPVNKKLSPGNER